MIQSLFPENITAHYLTDDVEYNLWKNNSLNNCYQEIPFPGTFRPALLRHVQTHLGYFPELGLIFHRNKLRFISCHKERPNWTHRLNELVFAFDIPTWVMLFVLVVTVAGLLALLSTQSKPCNSITFWNTSFL